jgi:hypothetical protein
MANVIAGIVALAIAIAFLGVLVYKVASVPLWAVLLLGAAMMVLGFLESARGDETR